MDIWVAASQVWVNNTYGSHPGYISAPTTGVTGWPTMYSLIRALQIELGITATSNTFGDTTLSQLTSQFGSVGASTSNDNIKAIIQCGLWCKGYNGGGIFGNWNGTVDAAVTNMNADLGLLPALPTLTPKAVKSLLSMDAYSAIYGGTEDVRIVQKWLNGKYVNRPDFFLNPTDGLYSRDAQKGLVFGLQYELGMADGAANGSFGPTTKSLLTARPALGSGSTDTTKNYVRLFQAALRFNGYSTTFDGFFGGSTLTATQDFQGFAELGVNGQGNFKTWASLLVSSGDTNRTTLACDTSTYVTPAKADTIYAQGHRTVGRYLNGTSKGIRAGELNTIFNKGMTFFPIYQEYNNAPAYFSPEIGRIQGRAAARRARQLGIKTGARIYFPVDWDPTDTEITALILPYFEGVADGIASSKTSTFKVGVYGTRNTCQKVSDAGLADASFVSGMSTGWSGNLGFRLPANWQYDQIFENIVGAGTGLIGLDKVVRRSTAVSLGSQHTLPVPTVAGTGGAIAFNTFHWRLVDFDHATEAAAAQAEAESPGPVSLGSDVLNDIVLRPILSVDYYSPLWAAALPRPEDILGPVSSAAIAHARSLSTSSTLPLAAPQLAEYKGQASHWAASALGAIQFGGLYGMGQSDDAQLADMFGWALDIVSCWDQYRVARDAGDYLDGVGKWMTFRIGSVASGGTYKMPFADVVSDVDALLVAHYLHADPSRPISDIMRHIMYQSQMDSRWRYQQFFAIRFGTRARLEGCIDDLWTNNLIWVGAPVRGFSLFRLPGQGLPFAAPPASELATERAAIATAVADRIMAFVSLGDAAVI